MEFKLIIKKLNKTLNKKEQLIFDKWYKASKDHSDYFDRVQKNCSNKIDFVDVEKGWEALILKLKHKRAKTNYWRYAVAATVIGVFAVSIYNFRNDFFDGEKENASQIVTDNSIKVGTDKAVLTLEDGSNVVLEKGQGYQDTHFESNGEDIVYKVKSSKETNIVKYNYLTIPRGGQFFIKLADGTQVWLNSESQLKYPINFISGKTRTVELVYGEAYFDVSHSSNHEGDKFKIINQNQEVEVLGTEFNIKAYKGENNIYTTLVQGRVTVSSSGNKQNLIPNQQTKLNLTNNKMSMSTVDVDIETSWKKGLFSFKGKPLEEIMVVLSRWYDVEFVFENKALGKVKFNGVIRKDEKIENLLTIIKNTNFINAYDIKDKKITIK